MKLARYNDILDRKTYPPDVHDNNETTSVSYIQIAQPDVDHRNVKNPELSPFILKYGCQIVQYRFYNKDENFENYEEFFKHFKTAFVPLSRAIPYLKKKQDYPV